MILATTSPKSSASGASAPKREGRDGGRWFDSLSVRAKLVGAFTPLFVAVVAFQVLYFPARQAEEARDALLTKGRSLARLVAHDASAAFEFGDEAAVREVFVGAQNDPDVVYLVLYKGDGGRFAAVNPERAPAVADFRAAEGREEVEAGEIRVFVPMKTVGGQRALLVAGFDARRIAESRRRYQLMALASGVPILVVGLLLILVVSSYVGRRLERFAALAERVAEGDLEVAEAIEMSSRDEVGRLSRSMQWMVVNLRRIVDNISVVSQQVASSAGQMSASAKTIARGAQEQSHGADKTSASVAEMVASIKNVADSAHSLAAYVADTSTSIAQMAASNEDVAKLSATLASTVAGASSTIQGMAASVDSMARSLDGLSETLARTTATVEQMASFIVSMAHNAEELSLATQRVRETVADAAGAVTQVAKNAEEADRISRQASEDACTGDEAVARTVESMNAISEAMESNARVITGLGKRSENIGSILGVIENIADQTNLLALNATIEAARAGDAGRGFAVVADEVRKLAERSVEAAKEIGEVIRQVQQETNEAVGTAKAAASGSKEGIARADRAGVALRRILESVSKSSGLMAEIAAATSRQSEASTEMLRTVDGMSSAAGQLAATLQQHAAGSRQIREAMENIDRVMAEAAAGVRRQAAGGQQVYQAVETVNRIASEVGAATRKQAEGSRQIIRAAESMSQRTQEVSQATSKQRSAADIVLKSMEEISGIARDNLATVKEMS
jgi:methyl-accepting chemotaxis protein